MDCAIERVRARVRRGGHNIPADIIRRRFDGGRRNFEHLYKGLVDHWALYDNTGDHPVLIDRGYNNFEDMSQVKDPKEVYGEQFAEKFLRGMKMAHEKLVREARLHNDTLVIWKDGQIKHVPAKDIKLEGE